MYDYHWYDDGSRCYRGIETLSREERSRLEKDSRSRLTRTASSEDEESADDNVFRLSERQLEDLVENDPTVLKDGLKVVKGQ